MYYIVDIPTCNRLGLQGAEVLVFSCLAYLCRDKGYWNGSYSKLAEYSLCGSKMTAFRICSSLVEKEVLTHTGTKFCVASQNVTAASQNGTAASQNGTISEKESTKEKEIIKEIRGGNNKTPSPDDFLERRNFIGSTQELVPLPSPCSKIEAASFGQQNGIPVEVVGKWWYHFEERGWQNNDGTKIHNWQSSLQKWFLREKQMNMLFITNGCPSRDSYNGCPSRGKPTEGAVDRNEQIRQAMLQQQREEREKAEKNAVPMPESLKRRLAAFGIV